MPPLFDKPLAPAILAVALAGSAAACTPQNATLTSGTYTAFLSRNTSTVFIADQVRVDDYDEGERWNIDCRPQAVLDPDLRLPDSLDICGEEGNVVVERETGPDSVRHEQWINRDAYVVIHEELDPWRGEAVWTSENDLQLTFHHRVPGNEFRFAIVVDPAFQPVRCGETEDGSLSLEPIDGDWIANWSRAMTEPNYTNGEVQWPGQDNTGTLIPLNAQSYQFDPNSTITTWSLPPTFEAGYAQARFGPEEMFPISSRYGRPSAYLQYDLDDRTGPPQTQIWWTDLNPDSFSEDNFEEEVRAFSRPGVTPDWGFVQMMRDVEQTAFQTQEELAAFQVPVAPLLRPVVPSNAWRKPDGLAAGFDGWGEMHYSWVRLDQSRDELGPGEPVSGEFVAWFSGSNSESRMMVQGTFEVDRVKKDRWTTRNVQQEKLEENNTNLCGTQYGDGE